MPAPPPDSRCAHKKRHCGAIGSAYGELAKRRVVHRTQYLHFNITAAVLLPHAVGMELDGIQIASVVQSP
jgi:hypothetical protein